MVDGLSELERTSFPDESVDTLQFGYLKSEKLIVELCGEFVGFAVGDGLVMVDGGKPQLSAAHKAFKELNLTLPLIALAKREEEIYQLGAPYPLRLPKISRGLMLLQRIRDEAHRFAITYQRSLRFKSR